MQLNDIMFLNSNLNYFANNTSRVGSTALYTLLGLVCIRYRILKADFQFLAEQNPLNRNWTVITPSRLRDTQSSIQIASRLIGKVEMLA